jgi:hypothetical protein
VASPARAVHESTAALMQKAVPSNSRAWLWAALTFALGAALLAIAWNLPAPPVKDEPVPAPVKEQPVAATPPSPAPRDRPSPSKPSPRAAAERPKPVAPVPPPPPLLDAPKKKGTLKIWVRPYALVTVDGRSVGRTPFQPLELDEGEHRLLLTNPELNRTHEERVVVSGDTVYRFSFEP